MASKSPAQAPAARQLQFSPIGRTRVEVSFDEPELTSDAGALLLREAARINGIIPAMAAAIGDGRRASHVDHSRADLLTQRIVQICHGYEDANDCDRLRCDAAIKAAAERGPRSLALASQPTMSRFENSLGRRDLIRLFYGFVDSFLDSYAQAPECILLDVDPTPNRVYGDQQLALFNAHYDEYCLMPFHVYEGLTGRLIATVLRPGKTPTKEEILALLKRLLRRIRRRFPRTTVMLRADSHHTKPEVLNWLEANDVRYVLGLGTNAVLARQVGPLVARATAIQHREWTRFRCFHSFEYGADGVAAAMYTGPRRWAPHASW